MSSLTRAEKFWKKIKKTEGCWLWTGAKNSHGYGYVKRRGKTYRTHRYVWEIMKGHIPSGVCVLHCCDVRNCVNPEHLYLGSYSDNAYDAHRRGHRSYSHLKGSKHGMAKLDESKVKVIKTYLENGFTCLSLSKVYQVSPATISRIKRKEGWVNI